MCASQKLQVSLDSVSYLWNTSQAFFIIFPFFLLTLQVQLRFLDSIPRRFDFDSILLSSSGRAHLLPYGSLKSTSSNNWCNNPLLFLYSLSIFLWFYSSISYSLVITVHTAGLLFRTNLLRRKPCNFSCGGLLICYHLCLQ